MEPHHPPQLNAALLSLLQGVSDVARVDAMRASGLFGRWRPGPRWDYHRQARTFINRKRRSAVKRTLHWQAGELGRSEM